MKKNWQKKEIKDAKSFGGKRILRSGGLWFAPGDVKTDQFLFDQKTSKHNRFSVTQEMWHKIYKEALVSQRIPALSVEFGDKNIELIIMSKDDFLTFFEEK